MIVEPDFPDHWKTQLLIQLTADPAAPMMVIRLWAHCQQRKTSAFYDMSNEALAAVCRWSGEPLTLRKHLLHAKFIEEGEDAALIVHQWDEVNAKLVTNWANGAKSAGRPKTHAKPTDNPNHTHGGGDREDREEKIDKRREDRVTPPTPSGGGTRKRVGTKAGLVPQDAAEPMRERMLALNSISIVNRRPSSLWNADEVEALKKSGLLTLSPEDFTEDLQTVGTFYAADIPREMEKQFWRRTGLLTLLRHWSGELDRARLWTRKNAQPTDNLRRLSDIKPQ